MPTYHAIAWMDHDKAVVSMFDRDHSETIPVRAHSHHKHQGVSHDHTAFFRDIATTLNEVHEVLVVGPGKAHDEFSAWCKLHHPAIAKNIVASIPMDHPTDKQLVALARKMFKGFDNMAADPALS